MKFLSILLLFVATRISAQTIDCQSLEKLQMYASSQKKTMRSHTISTTIGGTNESIMEIDTAKNIKTIIKLPPKYYRGLGEKLSSLETRVINGITYTKSNTDKVWTYKTLAKPDTTLMKSLTSDSKFEGCKKVGNEIIDGINYDIIETTLLMKSMQNKPLNTRFWVNFKDSTLRRTETNMENAEFNTKIVMNYGITISTIEKPQNAVPEPPKPNTRKTPEYKEGSFALLKFMKSSLVYPQTARDAKVEGTVNVKFMVEPDGSVCEIKIMKGIGFDCDQAAMDLVQKTSGNWLPALSFGNPIRSAHTLFVPFRL